MTGINGREAVLDILLELEKQTEYSNVLIAAVLDKYDYLDGREKAFIKRVSEGTIERCIQIDYILNQYSKTPVIKIKPLIRALLRMSVYQLLFMDHIPDAAVCNEAVKLVKKRGLKPLQGYVNGVLRNIARGRDKIVYPDREKETDAYLSVRYSMPLWLAAHFREAYGEKACEAILAASLERQPVSLRLREGLSEKERRRLFAEWKTAGVTVKEHPYHPCAVTVEGAEGIRRLAGYAEGLFAVQDVSSVLAVEAAGIKAGDTVIDVCAAPGGKALHAAQKAGENGKVIACDVSAYKTDKIEENRRRMKAENVSVLVQDARLQNENLVGQADVLLADVPCSGLGVIGHKQDIKYRVTRESLQEIQGLQREIITNVVEYIKPGGTLLYSTCTLNPDENEKMAEWICETFGFARASMKKQLPDAFTDGTKSGMLQLIPGLHDCDGFFMAKLVKTK